MKTPTDMSKLAQMFWSIMATVIAAGIIANFTILWQFNLRLARIESKLGLTYADYPIERAEH